MTVNNLRNLKILVYTMGLILIAGIILLFTVAYQRYQAKEACVEGDIELPTRGKISKTLVTDDIITIIVNTQTDDKKQVHVYVADLCTKKILSRVIVKP